MDMEALSVTLRLAAVTTLLLLAIAIPLAWWIAHGRSRTRAAVQMLTLLPLVLPPTVLGFYLLVWLGPSTLAGRVLIRLLGHPLAFSFSGLVVGSVLYSLPFAVQPLVTGFSAVPLAWLETAATLGAGPWQRFVRVVLPSSRNSLLAAAALVFAHTVGEFGVVLMIGGNIPGSTRTLSLSVYDQVQGFDYAAANRTALLLIALSLCGLAALYATLRRRPLA
jgi:molybdate transport system permease protein